MLAWLPWASFMPDAKSALHSNPEFLEIGMFVMGHSLIHSLVRSHICSLSTARFARALRCAHSFARTLHSLVPDARGTVRYIWSIFQKSSITVPWNNRIWWSELFCALWGRRQQGWAGRPHPAYFGIAGACRRRCLYWQKWFSFRTLPRRWVVYVTPGFWICYVYQFWAQTKLLCHNVFFSRKLLWLSHVFCKSVKVFKENEN